MAEHQTNFAEAEIDPTGGEGSLVEAPDINALTQLNAAEISQQITTARAYPRSITNFRRNMREMVTYDEPTALSCLYSLKRGGKMIEGPSIRFAEAAVQSWGNARVGARIVDIGDSFITAQGFFYDLEKNVAVAFEVMRRITNAKGERYNDDMIGVTGNAACSIALRNAVLKGIPKTAWDQPYQDARRLSIGQGESITIKRDNMLKAFAPLGVVKEQIFGLLGVKGIDDVSIEQMIFMNGVLNSIREGEQTVEQAFAPENMENPDQVAPKKPARSDFSQHPDTRQNANASADNQAKADAPPPATAENVEIGRVQPGQNTAGQAKGGDDSLAGQQRAIRLEQERLDAVRDAYAELDKLTGVRPINDLVDRVFAADFMSDAEMAAFEAAATTMRSQIMKAAREAKGSA